MNRWAFTLIFILASFGCKGQEPPAKTPEEPAKLSVTHWTDKTELFMEFSPLVARQKTRFAVHFTGLHDFKPLKAGQVEIVMQSEAGERESFSSSAPSRPGIFGVDVQPKVPGSFRMSVRLAAPGLTDTHELAQVTVFADPAQAAGTASKPTGEAITFLKEQQWNLEFATETAQSRLLRESLTVPGEVRPRTGGEVEVTTPISGRLRLPGTVPVVGTMVNQEQVLASIIPRAGNPSDRASLQLAIDEDTTALELARKDRQRVERLLAVGAIPSKRLEEANAAEATESARLKAAQARLSQYETTRRAEGDSPQDTVFQIRSPISGMVAESLAISGASVEEGEKLYRIVVIDSVYVVANLPEAEAYRLRQLTGGELNVTGLEERISLGGLVSTGHIVDPASRTLSIIYEVSNAKRLLSIGQSVSLRLFTSGRQEGTAISESAVVDDAGRPVVFVQVSGESFERRPVRLGSREGGYVHVLEGVRPGEHVVSEGAYLIRLAALSTQIPAHGHVH